MAVFYHRTSTAMKIRTDGNAFKAWRASIAIEAWDNFGLLLAIYFGDLCCCNFCQLLAQLCRPGEPALHCNERACATIKALGNLECMVRQFNALCVFGKRGPKMFNFELLFLHGFSSKNREILHKAV